ncbi:FAD binding domain protein [Colletotrichum tofieldiae]|nr:FAD binding domain protein [Colletotrichum tofieldiae]
MLKEWDSIAHAAHWRFCFEDGSPVAPAFEYEYNRQGVAQHAAFPLHNKSIIMRSQLAKMLGDQCDRFGISFHFGASITAYEENETLRTATAIAADGRRFTGEVVIAADGIGTKSHAVVLGQPHRADSTGFVKFRAVVPSSSLEHHPVVLKVMQNEQEPEVRLYFGGPGGRHHAVTILPEVVCFATAVKLMSIVLITSVQDDGTATESWSGRVTGQYVLSKLESPETIDPLIVDGFKALFSSATIVQWLLAMRDPQSKWTSKGERIVQVGDSAHSFLPTSGNGANTAIESSITIAECLRLGGRGGVSIATQVYHLLRQRVCVIQQTGLSNRQQMSAEPGDDILRQGKWIWTHRPEVYARENFQQARAHIEHGAPFKNANLPPGHKFHQWSLEEELAKEKSQTFTADLKANGDWSLV